MKTTLLLLFFSPLALGQPPQAPTEASQPVKVQTVYIYPDGRKVVVEETTTAPPKAGAKAGVAGCPTCGKGCDCKSCECTAKELTYGCQAATDAELAAYFAKYRAKQQAAPAVAYPPFPTMPATTAQRAAGNSTSSQVGTATAPIVIDAPPVAPLGVINYVPPPYNGYRGMFDIPQYTAGASAVRAIPYREPLLPGRRAAFMNGAQFGAACAGGK